MQISGTPQAHVRLVRIRMRLNHMSTGGDEIACGKDRCVISGQLELWPYVERRRCMCDDSLTCLFCLISSCTDLTRYLRQPFHKRTDLWQTDIDSYQTIRIVQRAV